MPEKALIYQLFRTPVHAIKCRGLYRNNPRKTAFSMSKWATLWAAVRATEAL